MLSNKTPPKSTQSGDVINLNGQQETGMRGNDSDFENQQKETICPFSLSMDNCDQTELKNKMKKRASFIVGNRNSSHNHSSN